VLSTLAGIAATWYYILYHRHGQHIQRRSFLLGAKIRALEARGPAAVLQARHQRNAGTRGIYLSLYHQQTSIETNASQTRSLLDSYSHIPIDSQVKHVHDIVSSPESSSDQDLHSLSPA
jgi:hypothetical protein